MDSNVVPADEEDDTIGGVDAEDTVPATQDAGADDDAVAADTEPATQDEDTGDAAPATESATNDATEVDFQPAVVETIGDVQREEEKKEKAEKPSHGGSKGAEKHRPQPDRKSPGEVKAETSGGRSDQPKAIDPAAAAGAESDARPTAPMPQHQLRGAVSAQKSEGEAKASPAHDKVIAAMKGPDISAPFGLEHQELMIEDDDLFNIGNLDVVGPDMLEKFHKWMDSDHDGKVTHAEALAYAEKMNALESLKFMRSAMAELDTDKDGKLSAEEAKAAVENDDKASQKLDEENEMKKFQASDEDDDGFLDEKELRHLLMPEPGSTVMGIEMEQMIQPFDKDKDGHLSLKEWLHAREVDIEDPHEIEDEPHPYHPMKEAKIAFKVLDKDGDSRLSPEEIGLWESGRYHLHRDMLELVEVADADGDGKLTADEMSNAMGIINDIEASAYMLTWQAGSGSPGEL